MFHFNKKHLTDPTIPMWVVKCRGDTFYVNHVDVSPGVGFSTKESPDNPSNFLIFKLFIIKNKIMSSKMNFLEKAKLIHGDKYDYSLVEYKTNVTKVKMKNSKTQMIKSKFSNAVHKILNPNPVKHRESWRVRYPELTNTQKIEMFDKIVQLDKEITHELGSYLFNKRQLKRRDKARVKRGWKYKKHPLKKIVTE